MSNQGTSNLRKSSLSVLSFVTTVDNSANTLDRTKELQNVPGVGLVYPKSSKLPTPKVGEEYINCCGPASTKMVAETYERNKHSFEQTVKAFRKLGAKVSEEGGSSVRHIKKYLRHNKIKARIVRNQTLEELAWNTQGGHPFIAAVGRRISLQTPDGPVTESFGHAVVVDGVTTRNGEQLVAIRDSQHPDYPEYFMPLEYFLVQWAKSDNTGVTTLDEKLPSNTPRKWWQFFETRKSKIPANKPKKKKERPRTRRGESASFRSSPTSILWTLFAQAYAAGYLCSDKYRDASQ